MVEPQIRRDSACGNLHEAWQRSRAFTRIDENQTPLQLTEIEHRSNELLSSLAHEMRNPLGPIRNSMDLLRMSAEITPEMGFAIDLVERQVERLVNLSNTVSDLSRAGTGEFEKDFRTVDLIALVRNAVARSQSSFGTPDHRVTMSHPESPITIVADATRLTQAIENLVGIAKKYATPEGAIWVSVQANDCEATVAIRNEGEILEKEILLQLLDLPPDLIRASRNARGVVDFQYWLTKPYIELHDGVIMVNSDAEVRGIEFVAKLPFSHRPTKADYIESHRSHFPQTFPKRRILILDDMRASALALQRLLEGLGQEVYSFDNALAALEGCKTHSPELVISDIEMPIMDGYRFAEILRQDPSMAGVPIVGLTGHSPETCSDRIHESGFSYQLVKPISLRALEELLSSVPLRHRNRQLAE